MPTNGQLIGSLVAWSACNGREGLGRVMAVNGAMATLRGVEFEDNAERDTGDVREVNAKLCHIIPTPLEIAEAKEMEKNRHLRLLTSRPGGKHEYEPAIREINTGVEPLRKLLGNA